MKPFDIVTVQRHGGFRAAVSVFSNDGGTVRLELYSGEHQQGSDVRLSIPEVVALVEALRLAGFAPDAPTRACP